MSATNTYKYAKSMYKKCEKLLVGDRNDEWGDPYLHLNEATKIGKLLTGVSLSAHQLALFFFAYKLSRHQYTKKQCPSPCATLREECTADTINYLIIAEMCELHHGE